MSKPLIVIADMDTAYLAELENKFLVLNILPMDNKYHHLKYHLLKTNIF